MAYTLKKYIFSHIVYNLHSARNTLEIDKDELEK